MGPDSDNGPNPLSTAPRQIAVHLNRLSILTDVGCVWYLRFVTFGLVDVNAAMHIFHFENVVQILAASKATHKYHCLRIYQYVRNILIRIMKYLW